MIHSTKLVALIAVLALSERAPADELERPNASPMRQEHDEAEAKAAGRRHAGFILLGLATAACATTVLASLELVAARRDTCAPDADIACEIGRGVREDMATFVLAVAASSAVVELALAGPLLHAGYSKRTLRIAPSMGLAPAASRRSVFANLSVALTF